MYHQIRYNNKALHYQKLGAGPAVVLLHGFGEDSSVWGFEKVLAEDFQLLIPDLPGSGRSERLNETTMESLAGAVHFLLQHEGIDSCVLIGHSMGGYVALAFAEKHPTRLKGLGLFHSSAFADAADKIETRKKGIQFMKEHGAAAFLKTTIPNLYSPKTKETAPSLIEQQMEATRYFSAEALMAYYNAMMQRPDRTVVLRNIAVPVLFIFGRWDAAVPLASGMAQCFLPQIAYIHVLDHSGHMGMAEEPEKARAILHQYLSETVGLL